MNDILKLAKAKVNAAFESFIGNDEAVYSITRSLTLALASAAESGSVTMAKTFLLSGAPSVGKTELARRITAVLDLPFVRLDGRALKTRDHLFQMIDDALAAQQPPLSAIHNGEQSGMPVIEYPPFCVFVDEIHLVPIKTQEAFLTLLEADDRTLLLNGERGRRLAVARQAAFIFSTTKPADLDRAFRSRCIEIQLRKYTSSEIQSMVSQRFPTLPDSTREVIAECSRLTPRIAFAMAQEVEEEIILSELLPADAEGLRGCVRRVMHGRGIRYANGVTVDDKRYLEVLKRENRPLGERALQAQLYDIDAQRIADDIEPFLLSLGYIAVTAKGRTITLAGVTFLKDAANIDQPVQLSFPILSQPDHAVTDQQSHSRH